MNIKRAAALMLLLHVLIALACIPARTTVEKTDVKPVQLSKMQVKIERFVKDRYIAECISKTKYPYIIAAIKWEETRNLGPNTWGDGGDSYGLYQVQPKHHGFVSDSVEHQTLQCERIVAGLIARHGIKDGIRRYNGSGPKARAYAQRVLRNAELIKNS
jgi:hypothetical protein